METRDYAHWQSELQGEVLNLSLNTDNALNTINIETLRELRKISEQVDADANVRAIILTGNGRHFCAGMDVRVIQQMLDADHLEFARNLREAQQCVDAFEAVQKPVIALIRGFCIGAGMILAACCDFRFADEKAVFSLPEVKRSIGVIMGLQRVTRLMGRTATTEMALLGDKHRTAWMRQNGFLNDRLPGDQLEEVVRRTARKLSILPPRAVRLNKAIIRETDGMDLDSAQKIEIEGQAELLASRDFREAMDSYFDGRPPHYTGA
ncbi:MAG: enoyl-CoA hydratase/isomerase family protein [Leptospiraceae bacterium]|nr:enoyl-CoA hydratase/isomerase family protein [Leptospiraceae bacterium]MCB1323204.1 enoyl-CoA hydratase/isomerase family protein [Leptospiraceae bacterium]